MAEKAYGGAKWMELEDVDASKIKNYLG